MLEISSRVGGGGGPSSHHHLQELPFAIYPLLDSSNHSGGGGGSMRNSPFGASRATGIRQDKVGFNSLGTNRNWSSSTSGRGGGSHAPDSPSSWRHEQSTPWKCEFCSRYYSTNNSLRNHRSIYHRDKTRNHVKQAALASSSSSAATSEMFPSRNPVQLPNVVFRDARADDEGVYNS